MTQTASTREKILLVDDEQDILEFMSYSLQKEGFVTFTALNGNEAIKEFTKHNPDLILLDIMMPDMDGIETCRQIRDTAKGKNVLIAFLTARNEDYSQIAGFDVGADDYIAKPIKPRVLVSRIKALLKRKSLMRSSTSDQDLRGLVIDKEQYTVFKNGKEIALRKKEFELLSLLTEKPGKVFTRDEILNHVWGNDVIVGDRTIDVHVNKLREKVGEKLIRTIKGIGYKFDQKAE